MAHLNEMNPDMRAMRIMIRKIREKVKNGEKLTDKEERLYRRYIGNQSIQDRVNRMKVYAFIAWDDGDDDKIVFLCSTEELAKELQDNHNKHDMWDHTKIKEMVVHDSYDSLEGWYI